MPGSSDVRRSASDRVLTLRPRKDLQISEVAFAGQASYVVKDPVSDEVFHLSVEEHALLEALQQPASLRSLERLIEARFPPRRASILELQQFVTRLYDQGLLVGENPGQGAELLQRGDRRRRHARLASLVSLLAVRVARFSAGPVVERLHRGFGWLCSRWALALAAVLVVGAGVMVLGRASEVSARLPQLESLARPSLWPLWIAAIAGVKIVHELGHALACRHFGARPQEMGVLLLAGAPSLYCDVSDAWRLPSKWQRMAVSSAGMGVELVIAAAAALVFLYAEPGTLSLVALSLVIVCSVGTLLVNLNPLLRYDGYYLLADWLEVPNLAERARGLVGGAWRRWLLGERPPDDALVGPRKRRALWVYAILAKAYLAIVLLGIFVFLLKLAKPYRLENVVYTLAVITAIGMALPPAMAAARIVRNPATRSRFRWLRLVAAMVLLAALVTGAMLLPVTRRVKAPVVLMPANSHPLFAVAAGELEFAVRAGDAVNAGDVVARLKNAELELAIARQEARVREHALQLRQLETLRAVMPAAARMIPTVAAELADARAQLAEQQAIAELLVVRSPAAGRILAPPVRGRDAAADKLQPWQGTPLDERNRGAWIEAGTPLAIVAEPGPWTAWAGVQQADVAAVEAGQQVRILPDALDADILVGRVTHVSQRSRRNAPDGERSAARNGPLGDESYHVVDVELDSVDARLPPVARGLAKIETYDSTLGDIVADQLRRTFRRVF